MRKSFVLWMFVGLAPILIGAISSSTSDLENQKFVECGTGTVCVRTSAGTALQTSGMVPSNGCTLQRAGGFINSATTTTVVATVAAQSVTIFGLVFMVGAVADTLTLQSTTPTNLIGTSATLPFAVNQGLVLDRTGQQWFASTASGTGLQIVTSSAGPLTWNLDYTQC